MWVDNVFLEMISILVKVDHKLVSKVLYFIYLKISKIFTIDIYLIFYFSIAWTLTRLMDINIKYTNWF